MEMQGNFEYLTAGAFCLIQHSMFHSPQVDPDLFIQRFIRIWTLLPGSQTPTALVIVLVGKLLVTLSKRATTLPKVMIIRAGPDPSEMLLHVDQATNILLGKSENVGSKSVPHPVQDVY